MRRTCASLLLLLLVAAMFAPLADASYGKSHACCLKKGHGKTAVSQPATSDTSKHACCTLATLGAAAPSAPRQTARPQRAHPIIEEFYPSAESTDPIALESERAPPAPSSD